MLLLTNSSNRTANPIASQKIADSDTVTAFSRESRASATWSNERSISA
jgi:hypothetical protein